MNVQDLSRVSLAWAQLWQVTLLVIVVAILVRLVARNRPHLAYALWLVVLVKCVTPPLFASPSGLFCWLQPARQVAVAECDAVQAPAPVAMPDEELVIPLYPVEFSETPTATELPAAERSRPLLTWADAAACSLLIWVLGTGVSLAVSVWRWRACLRRAGTVQRGEYAEFEGSVGQLAGRLGLRRAVRVLVTRSPFGPAVTGLLRPTLLMPEGLLVEKTPEELEPLLAHELIHIRRGDLWVGLLQTIVLSLWWFHPLIRWAVRQSMAEAERCCDEAVLAELQCRPRQYAQSLLSVLQYKIEWAPAAAFPGAGRIGGTSKRLERIMRLGQGCRRRSPWWCWAVMVATAALVLPGGAFVVSGEESEGQASPQQANDKANDKANETVAEEFSPYSLAPVPEPGYAWDLLGLQLEPIEADQFARFGTRYRGGLRITKVRPDSPADAAVLKVGDILIGLHLWETKSLKNVNYVLSREDLEDFSPIKYYLLRGKEMTYGHFVLRAKTAKRTGSPGKEDIFIRTYDVADLSVAPNFKPLIELITTTVAPDSWEDVGGSGSIAPFEVNRSLVIRQTEAVHEGIVGLLEQLRRLQKLQIVLHVQTVEASDEFCNNHLGTVVSQTGPVVVSPAAMEGLLDDLRSDDLCRLREGPTARLFNGQQIEIPIAVLVETPGVTERILLHPCVTGERENVYLLADVAPSKLKNERKELKRGEVLALEITDLVNDRKASLRQFLLVSVQPEVEIEERVRR